ncbi:MAG: GNAT family N-acetyltransferase [Marinicellaceae bacterium]
MKAFIHMMPLLRPAVTNIDINIESVRLEDVIDIRHEILRAGQPRSSCYYPEDSFKQTIHFAAVSSNDIVGVASVYKESHPDFSLKQSWRIRGMAVQEILQGQNIGTQLLESCVNHAIKMKADAIWCNARINAVKFYKNSGFKIIGDEFELPNIGPHFLLAKNLGIHIGQSHFLEIAKKLFNKKQSIPVPQPKINS